MTDNDKKLADADRADVSAGVSAGAPSREPEGWRDAHRDHLMATLGIPLKTAAKLASQLTYKPDRVLPGPAELVADLAKQVTKPSAAADRQLQLVPPASAPASSVIEKATTAARPRKVKAPAPVTAISATPDAPTLRQMRIIDAGAAIGLDQPSDADRAFLARQLVQATLPHSDPGIEKLIWSRRNGNLTLSVQQGVTADEHGAEKRIGFPYGNIPRLLLYWMTTEAVRKSSKRLELGDSLGSFMRELGLDPSRGGIRSDKVRLEEQMRRLFAARISFEATAVVGSTTGVDTQFLNIAARTVFWWSASNKADVDQGSLFQSFIELNQDFYDQITASPVPVDVRALRALQRSPLALDLYNLMSYQAFRAYKSGKPMFMTYKQMQGALGTNYTAIDALKKAIKPHLVKVLTVHKGLRLSDKVGGIEVLPTSRPAIPER